MKVIIIFSFLIFINTSFAQLTLSISAGLDPKEIELNSFTAEDGDNAYWNDGTTFGINLDYFLSDKLIITTLLHYSHYDFDKYTNTGLRIPEIRFLYAEGEDSKLWRLSVEAKYFPFSQKQFRFFILSGLGISVEDLGTIKTHYSYMQNNSERTNNIDSESSNSLVHSLGMGVRSNIISNLFLDLFGSYYSNYDDRFQTFFGLNLGYQIL